MLHRVASSINSLFRKPFNAALLHSRWMKGGRKRKKGGGRGKEMEPRFEM